MPRGGKALTRMPQRVILDLMMPHRGIAAIAAIGNDWRDAMVRLIKRYGSRKLYDTEESRYVLLEDIATWVRQGQEVRVIDSKTAEDVTAQTLTQIISEEGRRGTTTLPSDLLHELIRFSTTAVNTGVRRIQVGVDKFVQASMDRLAPLRQAREEMDRLRQRLEELETSILKLEVGGEGQVKATRPATRRPARKAPASRRRPARTAATPPPAATGEGQ
jgi:polyhydroxyalkanoate synthesis repressor PhaR